MTTTGEDAERPATGSEREHPQRPVTLESSLVEYEEGSDRRTIYPPGLSSIARMSTWLTADSDAFVDLDDVR